MIKNGRLWKCFKETKEILKSKYDNILIILKSFYVWPLVLLDSKSVSNLKIKQNTYVNDILELIKSLNLNETNGCDNI